MTRIRWDREGTIKRSTEDPIEEKRTIENEVNGMKLKILTVWIKAYPFEKRVKKNSGRQQKGELEPEEEKNFDLKPPEEKQHQFLNALQIQGLLKETENPIERTHM